jgi:hypothetical protein
MFKEQEQRVTIIARESCQPKIIGHPIWKRLLLEKMLNSEHYRLGNLRPEVWQYTATTREIALHWQLIWERP